MGAAWAWHGKCESDTAALCKSNGKDTFLTLGGTAWARYAMYESAFRGFYAANRDNFLTAARLRNDPEDRCSRR